MTGGAAVERVSILGLPVDRVDMAGAVARVRKLVSENRTCQIVTLNSEIAMTAQENSELAEVICKADLVVPDGAGIVWASRVLGGALPERVAGFDLMQELLACAAEHHWPVFFLGAEPGVAEEAAECGRRRLPGLIVAGTHHGFFDEEEEASVIEEINSTKPRLVFVGMGAPRQDFWIARNKRNILAATCIGVGGSFNVMAGRVKRAPDWMGRCGLEWLFRLACQPTRFVRMLALPRFVLRVIGERLT
ncbi:MAG TPA: WecB/TagA/CpsF family glycosyltransferase [Firmicutes bacterium]|jgi:N-acetylglucosaminyldiphosphoundecaprenol N-acetyl-beta-D-mannosaminyltransferase|nr:WecB/TagA/CpsF family glycosyltransferase [Bacillota bacterium]